MAAAFPEWRFFCRLAEVAHVIAGEVRERLVYGHPRERAMGRQPALRNPGLADARFTLEETDESTASRLRLRFRVEVRESFPGSWVVLSDSTEIEVGPDGILVDEELLEDPGDPGELLHLLRLGFGIAHSGAEVEAKAEPGEEEEEEEEDEDEEPADWATVD